MRGNVHNPSFWDVEDMDDFPPIREMTIEHAPRHEVDEFCRRYHYSNNGGSKVWNYGLWHGVTLLGIVSYNLPTRSVCDSVFGPEHYEHVWHMGRLAIADHVPRNAESHLIGGSMRRIQQEYPYVWAVLTYAATEVGHVGYVYQATNALYTGTGGDPIYFIDQQGKRRGRYLSGHVSDARAEAMGWTKYIGAPKHRYVYILGNKREKRQRRALLRYPVLPYPKGTPDWEGMIQWEIETGKARENGYTGSAASSDPRNAAVGIGEDEE